MTSLHFRPLVDAKELSGFKCGIEEMDDFIQNGLDESLVDNHCEAYVVTDIANTIVGFFALCQDTLCLDEDYKDDLLNGYSVTKIPNFIDENEKNAFLHQNVFTTLDVAYLAVIDNRQRDGKVRDIFDNLEKFCQKILDKKNNSKYLEHSKINYTFAPGYYMPAGMLWKHRFCAYSFPKANRLPVIER